MGLFDWFAKKNNDDEFRQLTRFEALDLLIAVHSLLRQERYGEAMETIGMTDDIFESDQSLHELMQAFQIRYIDLARYVGIDVNTIMNSKTDVENDESDDDE
jgi:hypothetical protein